jgi:hypothetical protein
MCVPCGIPFGHYLRSHILKHQEDHKRREAAEAEQRKREAAQREAVAAAAKAKPSRDRRFKRF